MLQAARPADPFWNLPGPAQEWRTSSGIGQLLECRAFAACEGQARCRGEVDVFCGRNGTSDLLDQDMRAPAAAQRRIQDAVA